MCRLLVTLPTGEQEIIVISPTGEYYDKSRVMWDDRVDGELPENVQLGRMQRDGNVLIVLDQVTPEHARAIYAKSVPIEVPMTAAREALINAGLFDLIDQFMALQNPVDRMWWDKSTTIFRAFPLVESARVALGLTQHQIDDLFIEAEQIRKLRAGEV